MNLLIAVSNSMPSWTTVTPTIQMQIPTSQKPQQLPKILEVITRVMIRINNDTWSKDNPFIKTFPFSEKTGLKTVVP